MNQPFSEKRTEKPYLPGKKPRILVAPLDWGLGHATRCIPIIRELLSQHADVWLAGEGAQEHLLKTEFPELPFLHLPGYNMQYAKTAAGLIWKMIKQLPKIQRAIKEENRWLKKMIDEHDFDAVISDNRYGLYHSTIPCFFITHQLTIKSSLGRWTEKILQKRNYQYINRFKECWIPDLPASNNTITLAGELSHPANKPNTPTRYIGLLSRFKQSDTAAKKNNLLIILSGPEPQRSILEEKIIKDISHYNGTATIVRGLPGTSSLIPSTGMIQFFNHLPANEMNTAMQKAEYVISRSGYSTIMDIVVLQKTSILIPTPGQTEQEYLGKYLQENKIAVCITQQDFSLNNALAVADQFTFQLPASIDNSLLSTAIKNLLSHSFTPALG